MASQDIPSTRVSKNNNADLDTFNQETLMSLKFSKLAITKAKADHSIENLLTIIKNKQSYLVTNHNEMLVFFEAIMKSFEYESIKINSCEAALLLILLEQAGMSGKINLSKHLKANYVISRERLILDLQNQTIFGAKPSKEVSAYKIIGTRDYKRAVFFRNLDYKFGSHDFCDPRYEATFFTRRSRPPEKIYKINQQN